MLLLFLHTWPRCRCCRPCRSGCAARPSPPTPTERLAALLLPLQIRLRGLSSMQADASECHVLYLNVEDADGRLEGLCRLLCAEFREAGLALPVGVWGVIAGGGCLVADAGCRVMQAKVLRPPFHPATPARALCRTPRTRCCTPPS